MREEATAKNIDPNAVECSCGPDIATLGHLADCTLRKFTEGAVAKQAAYATKRAGHREEFERLLRDGEISNG